MHIAVPGAIEHFYAMQVALTHTRAVKSPAANLYARFHQDIKFCRNLCDKMTDLPNFLAYLVHQLESDLGYINALGLGAGGGLDRPKLR